ncbi:MAG: quinolinate synthase NadA [Bdellovibrionaceae bacterium]|nr:quinolinate synthase NadA [Pseudobdellovibrionaceae bacterium]
MSALLYDEIRRLKSSIDAAILAHYYEDGDIQDIADYVGDSYFLAKKGQELPHSTILLAGVVFMAESVKILNPNKRVLVPDLEAGCSLVQASPYEKYLAWRLEHPKAIAVTYINSSAQVKAISDVIVTSSNAETILKSIPANRDILFGPDQHLGRWLSKKTGRHLILWPGSCQVHELFNAKKLHELAQQHPDAVIIAHPECDEAVLALASIVGSTSKLLEEVRQNPAKKFIVATESGIFHQMKKLRPDAELIQAPVADSGCHCNQCPYMKLNSLEKIRRALAEGSPEIQLPESLRERAALPLKNMLLAASGQSIKWPDKFTLEC